MSSRRAPLRAKIGGAFALLCLGFAGWAGWAGVKASREFEAWQVAEPVRMVVDLSVPGEYRGRFRQTCSIAHGEQIELRVSPAFESAEAAQAALAGLAGKVRVLRSNGEEEFGDDLTMPDVGPQWQYDQTVALAHFRPFPKGEYECVVRVTSPAAGLSGRRQELVGRYLLCGLERMFARANYIVCGIALLAGVVAGGLSYRSMRRSRRAIAPSIESNQFDQGAVG